MKLQSTLKHDTYMTNIKGVLACDVLIIFATLERYDDDKISPRSLMAISPLSHSPPPIIIVIIMRFPSDTPPTPLSRQGCDD